MIEIDVTELVNNIDCSQFSDSIFNIGEVTWNNSLRHIEDKGPLVTPEQQDDLRAWIRSTGGWDDEEVTAMSDIETNALLLQFIAGDIQVSIDECTEHNEDYSGNLYRGDDETTWHYTVSN